jgi:hypothetical protein
VVTLEMIHCANPPEERKTAVTKARPARAFDLNQPGTWKDKVFTTSTPQDLDLGENDEKRARKDEGSDRFSASKGQILAHVAF